MSRPPRTAAQLATSEQNIELATENSHPAKSSSIRQSPGWLRLLLWGVLLLALLPRLTDFFTHSFEVLGWQWQIDYDEGLNLSAAWHLSQGHNIYANSVPERFIAAPYPPFYFVLNALLIKLFGVSLLGGRLLTFLASLLIGWLIGLNVRWLALRKGVSSLDAIAAGLFGGLLWFCLPPVYIWSTFYKQDMVAIAVALTGLTLVSRWRDSSRLYWAAPVLALGFFAKQNELSAVGVAGLYVVWREVLQGREDKIRPNWKRAILLGLALAGCVLVPFILLNIITKNGYYNHIIGYQLVPWDFEDMSRRVGRVLGDQPALLALTALYLLLACIGVAQKWRKAKNWGGRLLALRPGLYPLYLAAAAASLFTVGAYQGNYNLVLDLFPPLLIVVGAALAWVIATALTLAANGLNLKLLYRTGAGLLAGLVIAGVLWQAFNFGNPAAYYSFGSMPGTERRGLMERLANDVRQAPGDFVTEDVYLPLSQGRAVPYDNLYHMRLQSEEGKWDDRLFLQDLRDRRFGLVLLEHGSRRWSNQGWQTLNDNYELVFPDGIDLWRPRARPLTPQRQLQSCALAQGDDRLNLQGFSLGPNAQTLKPGNGLTITTYWNAAGPVQNDYTLYMHLVDSQGNLVVQRDEEPSSLNLNVKPGETPPTAPAPTSSWKAGGPTLTIDQSLPLPASLAPGTYTLIVGAYRSGPNGLENLQPACSNATGSAISLGQVRIKG